MISPPLSVPARSLPRRRRAPGDADAMVIVTIAEDGAACVEVNGSVHSGLIRIPAAHRLAAALALLGVSEAALDRAALYAR